jgi:hypothetical protein
MTPDGCFSERERKRRARLETGRQLALCSSAVFFPPLTIIYVCWRGTYHLYKKTPKYKAKQREKQELRDATPPVPGQRERALSVSGQPNHNIGTNQQLQSRLYALPAELRLQIYQQLVGRRDCIHVALVYGHLYAYRCQSFGNLTVPEDHVQCWEHRTLTLGISGLLKSCRIM